jgi:hypothetical protein
MTAASSTVDEFSLSELKQLANRQKNTHCGKDFRLSCHSKEPGIIPPQRQNEQ